MTTNCISITSPGELDVRALSLMGASTKRGDDSKIGRFGSGMKYAMAYLLREGYELCVWIGERQVAIETKSVDLRGQTFAEIWIDGAPTNLTTALGPDWRLWQAIREIYCNALDEGAEHPLRAEPTPPRPGSTTFYIRGPGIESLVRDLDIYFPRREPIETVGENKILPRSADGVSRVYRRGILIHQFSSQPRAFDYDLHDIALNEERLPASSWDMEFGIASTLVDSCSRAVVSRVAGVGCPDLAGISAFARLGVPSAVWCDYLCELPLFTPDHFQLMTGAEQAKARCVNTIVFAWAMERKLGISAVTGTRGSSFRKLEPTPFQQRMLERACSQLRLVGIEPTRWPASVAKFATASVKALAVGAGDPETSPEILLSEDAFLRGDKYLLETLLEECLHHITGEHDHTRQFQDAAFGIAAQAILQLEALQSS